MSAVLSPSVGVAVDRDQVRIARTEWCLRIGAAACFIGHGAFGIVTKEAWVPYFAVAGVSRDLAYTFMPVVGAIDVSAGILVLLSPRPAGLLYMIIWAAWTALLRPLAGESFFEVLERAGNYGVPLALALMVARPRGLGGWLAPSVRRPLVDRAALGRVLLWSTASLLFAHGALQAITRKPAFEGLYLVLGVGASAIPYIGLAEMGAAVLVLAAPLPALLVAIAAWKMATEALYPISGAPIWEFIERACSYAAPIALVLLCGTSPFNRITFSRRDS
jgi:hypothetical protein